MTETTQADRDAAARAWAEDNDEPLDCHICEQIRAGYGDNSLDVIRFARHRMEERAAIVAWLRDDADQVVNADSPVSCADIIAEAIVECAIAIEAGDHLK